MNAMNALSQSQIIAITNQKGGVGKTTTTVNLAQALSALGFRVLMIDLDPQGNATQGLGLSLDSVGITISDLLRDTSLPTASAVYQGPGLDLIPATPMLARVEREMIGLTNSELRLSHRLKALRGTYSFILIDNAPGFGPLMNSALNAADSVLVPVDSSYYGLAGLKELLAEVEVIRQGYNSELHILGILLTLFDQTRISDEILSELTTTFGETVFEARIRRSVKLKEAPALGQTIFQHAPGSTGAQDYLMLANEVIARTTRTVGSERPVLQLVTSVAGGAL